MAGPSARVFLQIPMTATLEAQLRAEIARDAGHVMGDDFWVDERPFILLLGSVDAEERAEMAKSGLSELLGWVPDAWVGFAAMCNGDEDHQILAALCVGFAERNAGMIDLEGPASGQRILERTPPARSLRLLPRGAPGVLIASSYETAAGHFATCHYCDSTWLAWWMQDPSFRMVK